MWVLGWGVGIVDMQKHIYLYVCLQLQLLHIYTRDLQKVDFCELALKKKKKKKGGGEIGNQAFLILIMEKKKERKKKKKKKTPQRVMMCPLLFFWVCT